MRSRLVAGLIVSTVLLACAPRADAALDPAEAEAAIDSVQAYLNELDTLAARFVQIAADGSSATGELFIDRPYSIRLDYDPPSKILILSEGFQLIYYDGSIKQVTYIPLGSTPLGFLLDDEVSLEEDIRVTEVERVAGELHLTVVRSDEPEVGSVTLVFGTHPMQLRRWSVTDAQGLTTHIMLEGVQTGIALDSELFNWRDPRIYGYPED